MQLRVHIDSVTIIDASQLTSPTHSVEHILMHLHLSHCPVSLQRRPFPLLQKRHFFGELCLCLSVCPELGLVKCSFLHEKWGTRAVFS